MGCEGAPGFISMADWAKKKPLTLVSSCLETGQSILVCVTNRLSYRGLFSWSLPKLALWPTRSLSINICYSKIPKHRLHLTSWSPIHSNLILRVLTIFATVVSLLVLLYPCVFHSLLASWYEGLRKRIPLFYSPKFFPQNDMFFRYRRVWWWRSLRRLYRRAVHL